MVRPGEIAHDPELVDPYTTDLMAIRYFSGADPTGEPLLQPVYVEPEVTDMEDRAMGVALHLAHLALLDQPKPHYPIGSVWVVEGDLFFCARSKDWTTGRLNDHGEVIAYERARPIVGRDLSDATLVTTAVPCTSCTVVLAEGKP